jgi:hypothetical protein
MALKRNLLANYVGQLWTALMGLAFIPLYIRHLGIEAYGLVGLFASLQVWLMLMDMGLAPTMSREMARFVGGGHTAQGIRNLLRSVELLAGGIMLLMMLFTAWVASWIASDWLQIKSLPLPVAEQAIGIMGGVIALRLLEGIYRSCVIGLQHQVSLNVATAVLATLRWLGAVAALIWISPTLQTFFIWQGFSSLVSCLVLAAMTYRHLPTTRQFSKPSLNSLRGVGGFAGGMAGITLLTLLLTQIDKILLSRLLPLGEFGYYTVAATVAGGLYTLINPVTQAYFPRLCELVARKDESGLQSAFHTGAQLISVLAGSAALVVIFFSADLLQVWTRDAQLTQSTSGLLSVLILGNLLNSLMWMPYQAQLAHGWTRLTLYTNSVAVVLLVPAMIWLVPRYGVMAAAWIWVVLNAGYCSIAAQFLYRRILPNAKWRWYWQDIFLPLLPAAAAVWLCSVWLPSATNLWGHVGRLLLASVIAVLIACLGSSRIRSHFLFLKHQFSARNFFDKAN